MAELIYHRADSLLRQLQAEQEPLQMDLEIDQRSRTLEQYNTLFKMPEGWLQQEILHRIAVQPETTFIDLGCGNAVALRQAKKIARSRKTGNTFNTVGVDIFDINGQNTALFQVIMAWPEKYSPDLLDSIYRPQFIQTNMDTVQFSPADIVTISNALFWTIDPLRAIANAGAQTKEGGIMMFYGLTSLYKTTDANPRTELFLKNFIEHPIAEFTVLNNADGYSDALVLQKNTKSTQPDEIFRLLCGGIPTLMWRERHPNTVFHYSYYINEGI